MAVRKTADFYTDSAGVLWRWTKRGWRKHRPGLKRVPAPRKTRTHHGNQKD